MKIIKGIVIAFSIILCSHVFIFLYSTNKPYLVSCNSFLEIGKLEDWKKENAEIIGEISKYADDIVYDTDICAGKVGITLYHSTTKERNAIIHIAKSIFRIEGIPYRFINF